MKNYALGFLSCFFLFTVALTWREASAAKTQQVHTEYTQPGNTKDEFRNVYFSLMPRWEVSVTTPTVDEIDEGEFAISGSSTAAKNLFIKIDNERYYVPLINWP